MEKWISTAAEALRFLREHARRARVDRSRQFRLGLRTVDGRVRAGIDDERGLFAAHGRDDRIGIGQVELRAVHRDDVAHRREEPRELEADLALRAGHENRRLRHARPRYA